jgi:hypothetical protein
MAHRFVALINPCEIARFIKVADARYLRYKENRKKVLLSLRFIPVPHTHTHNAISFLNETFTYSELSLPSLFRSQKILILAELLADGNCIVSVGESGQIGGPLGALFWFHQKAYELFA